MSNHTVSIIFGYTVVSETHEDYDSETEKWWSAHLKVSSSAPWVGKLRTKAAKLRTKAAKLLNKLGLDHRPVEGHFVGHGY